MDPTYIKKYRDRHGKTRRSYRRGRFQKPLRGEPGTPEYDQSLAEAKAAYHAQTASRKIVAAPAVAGTMAALIADYRESTAFHALAPQSKKTYAATLRRIEEKDGHRLVADLDAARLEKRVGDMAARTPAAAKKWLAMMRQLLALAKRQGVIEQNPALDVPPVRLHSDGHRPWDRAAIAAYDKRHPLGGMARLAKDLLLFTGQRRGDAIRIARPNIVDIPLSEQAGGGPVQEIHIRQEKTGAHLIVPIAEPLAASIAAADAAGVTGDIVLLATARRRPFRSSNAFGNWFRKRCDEAGLSGLSAHGLRKSRGEILAEEGCSAHEIMAILGHESLAEAQRYTRSADQRRLARQAIMRVAERDAYRTNLQRKSRKSV